jgi:nanoRNase/pAp phosphatase (c-di-AMP/oligoRNAs hydrolase)
VGLGFLLRDGFQLDHRIATTGRIFRAENLAMVRELEIGFEDYEEIDPTDYAGIALVDTQPGFGHTPLPEGLPIVAVFDHHQPPKDTDPSRVPHYDVRLGLGATSAMMYEYVRDAGLQIDSRTATALHCGVRFDTGDLSIHTTPLDQEAFFETFRRADRQMLARINRPSLPPSYYRELHRSLSRARRHGPLVFGLLGRVSNPESVAEMADFFLRMEDARWSLVGGAYKNVYHLSLRTELSYCRAYPLMEAILDGEGSFGGRGSVAGGQIQLESQDEAALRGLERRLRARALKLVDSSELGGSDPRYGTRLTRLP